MRGPDSAYSIDAFQRTVLASFLPSGRLVAAAPSEDVVEALDAAASAALAGAEDGERRVLLAIPPGEGRSALVANWVAQRIQGAANGKGAPRECVAYHFATCSAASADSRVLLHRIVRRLEAYVDDAAPSPAAALDVAFDEAVLLERFEAVAKRAATFAPLVIAIDAADAVTQSADASGSPRSAMDWLVGPGGLAARLPTRACLVASVTMATPLSAAEQVAAGEAGALDAALVGETDALAAIAQVVSATPAWTLVAPGRAPSQSERQRAVSAFMDFKSGTDEVDAALAALKGAALGAAAAMEGQASVRTFLRAVECFASATAEGGLAEGVDALAPKRVCATLEADARAAAKRASVEQHTRCRAVTGALVESIVALWEGAGTNKTGQHRRGPVGFVAQQLRGILLCLTTARDGLLFGEMMDVVRDSAPEEAEKGGGASLSTPATEATWRARAEEARRRNRIASKPVVWRAVLEAMQAVGVLRVGDLLVVPRDADASPLRVWAAAQPAAARADAAATLVAFFVARRESAAATVARHRRRSSSRAARFRRRSPSSSPRWSGAPRPRRKTKVRRRSSAPRRRPSPRPPSPRRARRWRRHPCGAPPPSYRGSSKRQATGPRCAASSRTPSPCSRSGRGVRRGRPRRAARAPPSRRARSRCRRSRLRAKAPRTLALRRRQVRWTAFYLPSSPRSRRARWGSGRAARTASCSAARSCAGGAPLRRDSRSRRRRRRKAWRRSRSSAALTPSRNSVVLRSSGRRCPSLRHRLARSTTPSSPRGTCLLASPRSRAPRR